MSRVLSFGRSPKRKMLFSLALMVVLSLTVVVTAYAARERPIILGQTEGFADDELVVFDYSANFVCGNNPLNDDEEPPCQLGAGLTTANPEIDAAEAALLDTLDLNPDDIPDLVVISPFFNTDDSEGFFGIEAFDETPDVDVQCPETQNSGLFGGSAFGVFGHCIFHDHELDTAPLAGVTIVGLGAGTSDIPLGGVIPLPNHTHIVNVTPGGPVPWDTDVVLVFDPDIWPDKDGTCSGSPCLTSFDAIASATQATLDTATFELDASTGQIFGPIDSTLILFFGVHGFGPLDP